MRRDGITETRNRAYTLIELILVIALLGIASALLVPHLVDRDALRAEAAVRLLIADLSFAQSDALAHQEYRRVYFYDDGTGYCLIRVTNADFDDLFDPDTADYLVDPLASSGNQGAYICDYSTDGRWEDMIIESVSLDGGNRFVTYDQLGGTVSSGQVPGVGGSIVLTYEGGASYQIDVAPFTGKLTVVKLQ